MEHYFTNNEDLKSEFRTLKYEREGKDFSFTSDNGVFSKDKIDFGSRVLVDTILKYEKKRNHILDVGCGYGFIGIVLATFWNAQVTCVDVNKRALHLCEKNLKSNHVEGEAILSNAYEEVKDTYDIVVTNPPIRAGKETVLHILKEAIEHLDTDGILWFVIRKDQGAKSIMKACEDVYECSIMAKEKGFYVIRAKKH